MSFTKNFKYRMIQVSNKGKYFSLQLFKWRQGFNVQILGLSITYWFNRGSYKKMKLITKH